MIMGNSMPPDRSDMRPGSRSFCCRPGSVLGHVVGRQRPTEPRAKIFNQKFTISNFISALTQLIMKQYLLSIIGDTAVQLYGRSTAVQHS